MSLHKLTERSLPPHQSPPPIGSSVEEGKSQGSDKDKLWILKDYCLLFREMLRGRCCSQCQCWD